MKFSEDILEKLNVEIEEERLPVHIMQVREMLMQFKESAERIVFKSKLCANTLDADIRLDCIDIVTAKLNEYTQIFKDLIIFMRQEEKTYNGGTSLRYCISSYDTFEFKQTETEQIFLRELLLRNEITHDYFNRELHQKKLIWVMNHCADGAMDVFWNIYAYCEQKQLLDKYVNKN